VPLAALRPRSSWVLVDGNARRCEYAQTAVRAMGLSEQVDVVHTRAEDLGHDDRHRRAYDLVVARSFGPPDELAECALPLLSVDGCLVVSVVAATADRWKAAKEALGLTLEERVGADGSTYLEIRAAMPAPTSWPRRPAARRRRPIL
jgi:16S rRNA (guanine527-N7)-methyltransferase